MQVIEEGPGPLAPWSLEGLVLMVGDCPIDLATEERDVEARVIVYADQDCCLSLEPGRRYAALVVIPPRRYAEAPEAEALDPEEEAPARVPLPVDPATCRLHLWTLPETPKHSDEDEER